METMKNPPFSLTLSLSLSLSFLTPQAHTHTHTHTTHTLKSDHPKANAVPSEGHPQFTERLEIKKNVFLFRCLLSSATYEKKTNTKEQSDGKAVQISA